MFQDFFMFFCFVLIFLSKKSLFSKIVISLDYCLITHSVCLIQACKRRMKKLFLGVKGL